MKPMRRKSECVALAPFINLGRAQCLIADLASHTPAMIYNAYGFDGAHTDSKAREQSNSLYQDILDDTQATRAYHF